MSRSRRHPRSINEGAGLRRRRPEQLPNARRRRRISYKYLVIVSVWLRQCELLAQEVGQSVRCWPTTRWSARSPANSGGISPKANYGYSGQIFQDVVEPKGVSGLSSDFNVLEIAYDLRWPEVALSCWSLNVAALCG